MRLRDLKIGTRLAGGFGLVIVLIIISFYMIFSRVETLTTITEDMYNHPFTVTNTIHNVQYQSKSIQALLHHIIIFPDQADSAKRVIDSLDESIYLNIQIARERYLGEKTDLDDLAYAYSKLVESRSQIISDVKAGRIQDAIRKMRERETTVDKSTAAISKVLGFAVERSRQFHLTAQQTKSESVLMIWLTLVVLLILSGIISILTIQDIRHGVGLLLSGVRKIGTGDYSSVVELESKSEIGLLANELNTVTGYLRDYAAESAATDRIKTGLNALGKITREITEFDLLIESISSFLADYLNAGVIALYLKVDNTHTLRPVGGFGLPDNDTLRKLFKLREQLLGEYAHKNEIRVVNGLDENYFRISSGTGEMAPRSLIFLPLRSKNRVVGMVEAGLFDEGISDATRRFLESASETIGLTIEAALAKNELEISLKKTRDLAEELQIQGEELRESNIKLETQQEELRVANEELEEHANALRLSEEKLKAQQEELEVMNEELEEKNVALQRQKSEVQLAREELEIKAEELARSSKYKSEFLANMSHELRTPLNSLLILSQMLMDNKTGNLSHEEVESASVINKSGSDLLNLINEILDLSKIEAGKMEIHTGMVHLRQIFTGIESLFKHPVSQKGLEFNISVDDDLPQEIETDRMRIEQILKNLLTNAIKFTESGSISVKAAKPDETVNLFRSGLSREQTIAISVTDTGIGIPAAKQKIIFEAFQQADGSTSREFGGTGLGLSISRELAKLLGGEIQLQSRPGEGSTFTIFLPITQEQKSGAPKAERRTIEIPDSGLAQKNSEPLSDTLAGSAKPSTATTLNTISVKDDRGDIKENDRVVLIVEDDPVFAELLYKQCKEQGLKAVIALSGNDGLTLVSRFSPIGILLDLGLPDINGLDLLSQLKENSATRHIPVHIITGSSDSRPALQKGAIGFLTKPVGKEDIDDVIKRVEGFHDKDVKDILLIEDHLSLRTAITKLIGGSDVKINSVGTGAKAIEELKSRLYDLVILDLGLPDMTGFELLHFIDENQLTLPPVIVYTGKDLTREEDSELRHYAESIIIKGVRSEERLLDEAALFLHRLIDKLPEQKRKMIIDLHETDAPFRDKTVLIVDDDMRNVFALAKLLSGKGMNILKAENGVKALEIIKSTKDIDLILMDIMMPVMDGYETIRRIRQMEENYKIPVIAVTAKAMRKDYEQCIAAGASDYLPKPVDIDRLFSLMRVWLYR